MRTSFYLLILILCLNLCFLEDVKAESHIKITGIAGQKPPDVPLADISKPDIILDGSLAGDVNVDVSTLGVPDGTKVRIKFKDEENLNSPESVIQDGMATIPVNLEAGHVKVLYAETSPYVPIISSASNGKLDFDPATVALYRFENNINDDSGHGSHLSYSGNGVRYVAGISSNSAGIKFDAGPGYERVYREGAYGSGFTSLPTEWSIEYFIKPYSITPSETWYPFVIIDTYLKHGVQYGKSLFTGEENRLNVSHLDKFQTIRLVDIPNPLISGKWNYLAYTHDGRVLRVYVNGEEKGSVISEGNFIGSPWGYYGLSVPAPFSTYNTNPQIEIDEIRISNIARTSAEIKSNAQGLLGNTLLQRSVLAANKNNKDLTLDKKKKSKVRKEIRAQVYTTSPQEGEPKADKDTIALFHFNGTTKDSITKNVLVGDPDVLDFKSGKNGSENSSISFEGKDDLLLVNKKFFPAKPKEWTIDFFSKPQEGKTPFPVGLLTVNNGQVFAMISYLKTTDGKAIFSAFSLDANEKPVLISYEGDFPSDRWTHCALTYANKKLRFLINGKLVGEESLPSLYKKGDGTINVGSDGGDGIFRGEIDELRISDVARSDVELEVYAKR